MHPSLNHVMGEGGSTSQKTYRVPNSISYSQWLSVRWVMPPQADFIVNNVSLGEDQCYTKPHHGRGFTSPSWQQDHRTHLPDWPVFTVWSETYKHALKQLCQQHITVSHGTIWSLWEVPRALVNCEGCPETICLPRNYPSARSIKLGIVCSGTKSRPRQFLFSPFGILCRLEVENFNFTPRKAGSWVPFWLPFSYSDAKHSFHVLRPKDRGKLQCWDMAWWLGSSFVQIWNLRLLMLDLVVGYVI